MTSEYGVEGKWGRNADIRVMIDGDIYKVNGLIFSTCDFDDIMVRLHNFYGHRTMDIEAIWVNDKASDFDFDQPTWVRAGDE